MGEEKQPRYQKMYFDINSLSAAGVPGGDKTNGAGQAFVKAVIKHSTQWFSPALRKILFGKSFL